MGLRRVNCESRASVKISILEKDQRGRFLLTK